MLPYIEKCLTDSWCLNKRFPLFLSLLAIIAGSIYLLYPPNVRFMMPDSMGYFLLDSSRTAGYPLFLWLVDSLPFDRTVIKPIQLAIFLAALTYMLSQLAHFLRSTLAVIAIFIFTVGNVEFMKYHFTVLTESLSMSCILLLLACIIQALRKEYITTKQLTICFVILGFAILVRPVNYALIVVLTAYSSITILQRSFTVKHSSFIIPIILLFAILSSGASVHYLKEGKFTTQSFIGHNLIGKTAFLEPPKEQGKHPDIIERIDSVMVGPREKVKAITGLRFQYLFSAQFYDVVRYTLTQDYIEKKAKKLQLDQDAMRKNVAITYMRQDPVGYVKDIFLNLYSLWILGDLLTYSEAQNFNQQVKPLLPLVTYDNGFLEPKGRNPYIVYGVRTFYHLSLIATLFVFVIITKRVYKREAISPFLLILFVSSLSLHGVYSLTALLQAGIARYSIAMWPLIVITGLTTSLYLLKKDK